MPLTYNLREGMINQDLYDEGYTDDSLFSLLSAMMLTGVSNLEPANLARFTERWSEYAAVSSIEPEYYRSIYDMAHFCQGMTANIKQETKTQWKHRLHSIVSERARAYRNSHDSSN